MTDFEILKHYRTILVAGQFVVTGSFVIHHLGLINKNDDLDIILVDPSPESIEILKRLQGDNPAKTSPKGGEVKFIFMHDSKKIDVFIQDNFVESKLSIEGIQANTLMNIIKAKQRFNRMKDLIQLRFLSKLFFTNDDLIKKMDSVGWNYTQYLEKEGY